LQVGGSRVPGVSLSWCAEEGAMADSGRAEVLRTIASEVERALGGGPPLAVATVMDVGELTGIELGTKMLVRRDLDSTTVGSIDSGGTVDAAVIEGAKAAFETFPRVPLQTLYIGLDRGAVTRRSQARPGDARLMLELFEAPARLVISGGGHVGLALATLADILGFTVTVIDDRPEFANKERFPMADEVLCGEIGETLDGLSIDSSSYVVLVSRGHQQDTIALKHTATRGAAYVGMIGSRRRTATVLRLLAEEGLPEEALAAVHTPIGLDIGAETPEEIALAILAEMVLVRKGGTGVKLSTLASRRQADRPTPGTGLR
jgi:xanthine dehydrogenase accessory factor